jgi:hypothetical protein
MRKSFVALGSAAVAGSLLLAAPALAAQPEVNKKSCDAQGGAYTMDQGTKSCTTTTTKTVTSPDIQGTPTTPSRFVPRPLCGVRYAYTGSDYDDVCTITDGTFYQVYTQSVTTTRSQKGNGDVTTTSTEPVVVGPIQTVPVSCSQIDRGDYSATPYDVPFDVCQNANVYS